MTDEYTEDEKSEIAAIKVDLANIESSLNSLSETTTQLRIAIEFMIADGSILDTNPGADCADSQA